MFFNTKRTETKPEVIWIQLNQVRCESTCRHRWCRFIWLKTTLSPTNIYFTQVKSYIYYQVNILTASSNVVWQKQFSMAPGRLYFCSGLKVHLPFHGVDWNPEHFHTWKTEDIQWDKCSASYLLVLIVMYGYRSCVGLPFCIFGLHIITVQMALILPLLKVTIWWEIIASPAQCVLALPRLLCGEVTFSENTYGCQICLLVFVPVFSLKVSCAVAPAPPPSFRFQLIAQ